jgi:hypothetical protein
VSLDDVLEFYPNTFYLLFRRPHHIILTQEFGNVRWIVVVSNQLNPHTVKAYSWDCKL